MSCWSAAASRPERRLPGGGQELGETAQEAARRELLEETALEVGPLTLAAQVDSIRRDEAGRIRSITPSSTSRPAGRRASPSPVRT